MNDDFLWERGKEYDILGIEKKKLGLRRSKQANFRTPDIILRDKKLMTELLLKGYNALEMSQHKDLKHISVHQIYKDLEQIRSDFQEHIDENMQEYLKMQLTKLNDLYLENYKQFKLSQRDEITRTRKEKE